MNVNVFATVLPLGGVPPHNQVSTSYQVASSCTILAWTLKSADRTFGFDPYEN